MILFDETLIADTNVTGKLLKFNATCHRWMNHTVPMNKVESDDLQTCLAHLFVSGARNIFSNSTLFVPACKVLGEEKVKCVLAPELKSASEKVRQGHSAAEEHFISDLKWQEITSPQRTDSCLLSAITQVFNSLQEAVLMDVGLRLRLRQTFSLEGWESRTDTSALCCCRVFTLVSCCLESRLG